MRAVELLVDEAYATGTFSGHFDWMDYPNKGLDAYVHIAYKFFRTKREGFQNNPEYGHDSEMLDLVKEYYLESHRAAAHWGSQGCLHVHRASATGPEGSSA